MDRIRRRLRLAALLAVIALGATACGKDGAPGAVWPAAAELVPASTAVFIVADTDFESSQWQAAEALLARFPSGNEAIQSFVQELAGEGVDAETDLGPAFGPETGLAVLELSDELESEDNAPIVLVTRPSDPAKLEALLARDEDGAAVREVGDGWYMVADNEAIIDRALSGAEEGALAESDAFREALEELPAEAAAKLYVNGHALSESLAEHGAESPLLGSGPIVSVAIAVTAEPRAVRLTGVLTPTEPLGLSPYAAELPAVVPGGTAFFVSFSDLATGVETLLDAAAAGEPDLDEQLGQLQGALGISLEEDLLPLLEGEQALYVRPGSPAPEVTLLLSPADPAQGVATIDKLVAAMGRSGTSGPTCRGSRRGAPPSRASA